IITMDKTSIEKIEIEKKDLKIMISKEIGRGDNVLKSIVNDLDGNDMPTEITAGSIEEFKSGIGKIEFSKNSVDDENTCIVKSPMVGVFYKASGPNDLPFVNIGDTVRKGQTLCIIEAMKIMNEIECEYEGQVIEIFAEDEGIVEFGQPLMLIGR
ncbi:MAG TPA: acetyl-CoA carboxylase biotin carboxyl carrier protein, partial [Clostridia bacterium]|nr:acetyl-CoA carboxylase biotin carboxyl carrier protein [Clostridia bacterium]